MGGVALCLAAIGLTLAVTGCGDSPASERAPPPATVQTADPVRTFAPLVHLAEREPAKPIAAAEFIDYSSLTMANDPCPAQETIAIGGPRLLLERDDPAPVLDPARLGRSSSPYRQRVRDPSCRGHQRTAYVTTQHTRPYDPGRPRPLRPHEGFYLDLLSSRLLGTAKYRRAGGQLYVHDAPVYHDARPERVSGRPGLRIDYWLLYGFNGYLGSNRTAYALDHEGDWERISVLLQRGRTQRLWKPTFVRYHVHGAHRDVPWDSVETTAAGASSQSTHPVAYAATGNHAPYPRAGKTRVRHDVPDAAPLPALDERRACADCPRWRTWRDLRSVRRQPWYGYGGAWGAVDAETGSAPIGPSPYTP